MKFDHIVYLLVRLREEFVDLLDFSFWRSFVSKEFAGKLLQQLTSAFLAFSIVSY